MYNAIVKHFISPLNLIIFVLLQLHTSQCYFCPLLQFPVDVIQMGLERDFWKLKLSVAVFFTKVEIITSAAVMKLASIAVLLDDYVLLDAVIFAIADTAMTGNGGSGRISIFHSLRFHWWLLKWPNLITTGSIANKPVYLGDSQPFQISMLSGRVFGMERLI